MTERTFRRRRAKPRRSAVPIVRSSRRFLYPLLAVLVGSILAGCSPFAVVNAVAPSDHYRLSADIPYGAAPRQGLDVYRPANQLPETPLIVFFYGGGWDSGSRAHYEFVAAALTGAGYVVVLPDYRLYPEVRFPEFVEDGAAAVAWVLANAGDIGWDGGGLYLVGHSAGAHIAALLATDEHYLNVHGVDLARISGFVGLSGPYDFLPLNSDYLQRVFPEPLRAQSQPIAHASHQTPASLLIHGLDDAVVEPGNSERFSDRLSRVGVSSRLLLYPDVGHVSVVASLVPGLSGLAETEQDIVRFINRQERLRSRGLHVSADAVAADGAAVRRVLERRGEERHSLTATPARISARPPSTSRPSGSSSTRAPASTAQAGTR